MQNKGRLTGVGLTLILVGQGTQNLARAQQHLST